MEFGFVRLFSLPKTSKAQMDCSQSSRRIAKHESYEYFQKVLRVRKCSDRSEEPLGSSVLHLHQKASNDDKKYSSDEEKQETLQAIFMLQELVRRIEAGEVTPPTGENLE